MHGKCLGMQTHVHTRLLPHAPPQSSLPHPTLPCPRAPRPRPPSCTRTPHPHNTRPLPSATTTTTAAGFNIIDTFAWGALGHAVGYLVLGVNSF